MSDAKKKLDELKAQHGDIASVELGNKHYYFRKPSMPEYQRVSDKIAKSGSNVSALKELVYTCSVGEDPEGALAALPAAIQEIGLGLLEMAGSEVQVTISKA